MGVTSMLHATLVLAFVVTLAAKAAWPLCAFASGILPPSRARRARRVQVAMLSYASHVAPWYLCIVAAHWLVNVGLGIDRWWYAACFAAVDCAVYWIFTHRQWRNVVARNWRDPTPDR